QPARPTDPQTVVMTINGGLRILHARYLQVVFAGGIRDVAGNALDGSFFGRFPTGSGQPGSNFVALLPTDRRVPHPPQPVFVAGPFARRVLDPAPTIRGRNLVTFPRTPIVRLFPSFTQQASRVATPFALNRASLPKLTSPWAGRRLV